MHKIYYHIRDVLLYNYFFLQIFSLSYNVQYITYFQSGEISVRMTIYRIQLKCCTNIAQIIIKQHFQYI